jgi:outer membrane protein assembly complex protein YaeT
MDVVEWSRTAAWIGALFLLLLAASPSGAVEAAFVPLDDLDARRAWRITTVEVEGLDVLQRFLWVPRFQTQTRAWWVFWRARPDFQPGDLQADAQRLQRELHALGFYHATTRAEVEVLRPPGVTDDDPGLLRGRIVVDLGERVQVCRLEIRFGDLPIENDDIRRLRKNFAIVVGENFTESDYQGAAQQIVDYLGEHGYAAAQVTREAVVDLPRRCVHVTYTAQPGEMALFGQTSIDGLTDVAERIVRQEIVYEPGEIYDTRKVAETIRRLRGLRLFTIVRLVPEGIDENGDAPMRMTLTEGPPREIRLGAGYSTEDGVRGLASWTHYNWLGGGRQLGFSARISQVRRLLSANFTQPYFPAPSTRTLVNLTVGQDDESTYVDDFVRVIPRVEWRAAPNVDVNFSLVASYDSLSSLSDASKEALPGFVSSGFTVAPGAGIRWIEVDDSINPTKGFAVSFATDVASTGLGSDFDWYRLYADSRTYVPVHGDLVASTRLSAGTIVPYGGTTQIQFWDRFYAGGTGINPVRGYGRRRVGPLSGSDDPIGGRSVVIGSLELRHPIFGPVQGVAFVDAGDVELSAWQFQWSEVQTGVGFGLRANTPVGPAELGVGFGLNRRGGDSLTQVYFNIGPDF